MDKVTWKHSSLVVKVNYIIILNNLPHFMCHVSVKLLAWGRTVPKFDTCSPIIIRVGRGNNSKIA